MTRNDPDDTTEAGRVAPGSQAGDELDETPMQEQQTFSYQIRSLFPGMDTEVFDNLMERIEAYAERLATERAIRELSTLPRYEYPVGKISEHKYAVAEHMLEQRIAELRATLTGKAES